MKLTSLLCLAAAVAAAATPYQFMQPGSEIDRRAAALVREMTLDEKIGQMTQVDTNVLLSHDDITKYALGSVLSGGSSDPKSGITARDWSDHYDAHYDPLFKFGHGLTFDGQNK